MNDEIREMPHSEGHEKSILSSLMRRTDMEGVESITAEHFASPARAEIFRRVIGCNGIFDPTSMMKQIHADGQLDSVGGAGAIADIMTYSPTDAHFAEHLEVLHKLRSRRLAIAAALDLMERSYDETDESFLEAAGEPITAIHDAATAAKPSKSSRMLLKAVLTDYEGMVNGSATPVGIKTSLRPINDALKGLHTKQVGVISGYPTGGKTVLGAQLAIDCAVDGSPSLMISMEMPAEAVMKRCIVYGSGIKAKALYDPIEAAKDEGNRRPTKDNIKTIKDGAKLLAGLPFFIEDPTGGNIGLLSAMIRRHVRRNGVKVVVVDYLQLIKGKFQAGYSKEQEVANISHAFQALAKELDICVVLLSQQNKEGATKYAEAIAEDADWIISIIQQRDPAKDDFGKHLYLFLRKDRHHGNTGEKMPIILTKEEMRFEVEDRIENYQ